MAFREEAVRLHDLCTACRLCAPVLVWVVLKHKAFVCSTHVTSAASASHTKYTIRVVHLAVVCVGKGGGKARRVQPRPRL